MKWLTNAALNYTSSLSCQSLTQASHFYSNVTWRPFNLFSISPLTTTTITEPPTNTKPETTPRKFCH